MLITGGGGAPGTRTPYDFFHSYVNFKKIWPNNRLAPLLLELAPPGNPGSAITPAWMINQRTKTCVSKMYVFVYSVQSILAQIINNYLLYYWFLALKKDRCVSLSKFGQYLSSGSRRDTLDLQKMPVIVTHSRQTCLFLDMNLRTGDFCSSLWPLIMKQEKWMISCCIFLREPFYSDQDQTYRKLYFECFISIFSIDSSKLIKKDHKI